MVVRKFRGIADSAQVDQPRALHRELGPPRLFDDRQERWTNIDAFAAWAARGEVTFPLQLAGAAGNGKAAVGSTTVKVLILTAARAANKPGHPTRLDGW